MVKLESSANIAITPALIEISVLRVGQKQMTKAVWSQIPRILPNQIDINEIPLGYVNLPDAEISGYLFNLNGSPFVVRETKVIDLLRYTPWSSNSPIKDWVEESVAQSRRRVMDFESEKIERIKKDHNVYRWNSYSKVLGDDLYEGDFIRFDWMGSQLVAFFKSRIFLNKDDAYSKFKQDFFCTEPDYLFIRDKVNERKASHEVHFEEVKTRARTWTKVQQLYIAI